MQINDKLFSIYDFWDNISDYIKEHLFQFISLIPVCFIAIGAFVLNIYLYQFGIIDIALFDSKTIFVGFVAVLQMICYFFLYCTFFCFINLDSEHSCILFCVNMLWKPVLFSIIVYSFLGNEDNIKLLYSGWRYEFVRIMMSISIAAFPFLLFLHNDKNFANLKTKKDKLLVDVVVIIELISTYGVYSFLVEDHSFQKICETYMTLSAVCSIFALILIYGKFPLVNKKQQTSFFRVGDKPMQLDYYCSYFGVIILSMVALSLYSTRVFPYISNNLGGGDYKFNTIVFEDNTSTIGKIIYNNSDYIYMIEEENQLSQYPIDKIKRYIFMEKEEDNIADYEEPIFEIIEDEDLEVIE